MRKSTLLALAVVGCTDPRLRPFTMPKSLEDVRGRLLPHVEGHEIGVARGFMHDHGFDCDAPLASATDAHAHLCHAIAQDAGFTHWTIILLERNARVADVQTK